MILFDVIMNCIQKTLQLTSILLNFTNHLTVVGQHFTIEIVEFEALVEPLFSEGQLHAVFLQGKNQVSANLVYDAGHRAECSKLALFLLVPKGF
jgi:hypothetical protein